MKKTLKIAFIIAVLQLFCVNSFAQLLIGAGYARQATATESSLSAQEAYQGLDGVYAGISSAYEANNFISCSMGLFYEHYSHKFNSADYLGVAGVTKATYQYLKLPIQASLNLKMGDVLKFVVFAGPTPSLGLSAKAVTQASTFGYSSTSKIDLYKTNSIRRFDVYLTAGAGIEFGSLIQFRVCYNYGLINQVKNSLGSVYDRQLNIGLFLVLD